LDFLLLKGISGLVGGDGVGLGRFRCLGGGVERWWVGGFRWLGDRFALKKQTVYFMSDWELC